MPYSSNEEDYPVQETTPFPEAQHGTQDRRTVPLVLKRSAIRSRKLTQHHRHKMAPSMAGQATNPLPATTDNRQTVSRYLGLQGPRGHRMKQPIAAMVVSMVLYKQIGTEFKAKYEELGHLGEGGFGAVYHGYRKEDFLPVAIKHIALDQVIHTPVCLNGQIVQFPLEVLLLYKVGGEPGSHGQNAAVTLLDHYELDQELILVMERPAPCMDLFDYVKESGGSLQEHEAKILLRQLVEAMLEIHGKGVSHGDIKFENLLVETGSRAPRLRLIDFGCGSFLEEGLCTRFFGTADYTPPEWYARGCHSAATTTVWQLGVLLYGALTGYFPFSSTMGTLFKRPVIKGELSQYCQNFLRSCLAKNPKSRPTLASLLLHPWLR
uniref:serine/threonine-protein kinase pim-2-like n=1 Tax=Centroberyx gerrardi TaxID=166262 RepID=UPI003AAB7D00